MACVGAWECEVCGGLRFTAEGSTDPVFKEFPHYTKLHVCNPAAVAEKRYMDDPRLTFEEAFDTSGSAATEKDLP